MNKEQNNIIKNISNDKICLAELKKLCQEKKLTISETKEIKWQLMQRGRIIL